MKTPLRLAVLALTTLFFVFTYQSRNDAYSTSLPSRLILKSRGYLPQAFLGWEKSSDRDGNCSLDCMDYEMGVGQEHDDVVIQEGEEMREVMIEGVVMDEVEEDDDQEDEHLPQWTQPLPGQEDKIVIMGKMSDEYTDWVEKELPEWQRAIYHVDYHNHTTTHANLTSFALSLPPFHHPTPHGLNKGREALPYLTYIIQNYHSPYLPSTLAFVHPHRDGYPRAWHTDSPGHSMPAALKALKTEYIQEIGYANLRCNLDVGCPAEVRPLRPSPTKEPEAHMAAAWPALFPERAESIPEIIAAPCCAQFAVSRDAVLARPLEDYVRFRDWVVDSELSDYVTGRVMEYLWHVIFRPDGADTVLCPDTATCYCLMYGRMCGRGRASGFSRVAEAQAKAFEAVALAPVNQGPPAGVQGKKWFPQEHGTAWTTQEEEDEEEDLTNYYDEEGEANDGEVTGEQKRTLPLPPPPVGTPEEVEAGEIAALARTDALRATDPIAWAKSRVAVHNDLVDAKAMIDDAGKANPAPPPRLEQKPSPHPPPPYSLLSPSTTTSIPEAATVTTIPAPPTQQTEQSQAYDVRYRPHPRKFAKSMPDSRPVVIVGEDPFDWNEVDMLKMEADIETGLRRPEGF